MESARLESGEESREEAEFFAKLHELAANAEKRMQETQETTDTEISARFNYRPPAICLWKSDIHKLWISDFHKNL